MIVTEPKQEKNIEIIKKDWWAPEGRAETSGIRTEN